ncbi:hypothetical protein P170DRAFT_426915 [Aspergillus steynii IBT 23096]|uniref:Uncharacterized protein n=1 Tax=Aspergillus steynii IBT 23096 TaxID=1392250 RepID=A0A2I2G497_9EURO|nr:uncharacterized protein P170DRAFT_426915 [Aspergillus steynii IBT 23096]PLB47683.1 hypothetical protein P170DRAFT_426915 [Aspergillus steynii IBT 23096]
MPPRWERSSPGINRRNGVQYPRTSISHIALNYAHRGAHGAFGWSILKKYERTCHARKNREVVEAHNLGKLIQGEGDWRRMIGQMATYLKDLSLRYGFLSTYEKAVFFTGAQERDQNMDVDKFMSAGNEKLWNIHSTFLLTVPNWWIEAVFRFVP